MGTGDSDGAGELAKSIRKFYEAYAGAHAEALAAQERNADLARRVVEGGAEALEAQIRAQAAFNLRMTRDMTEVVRAQSEAFGRLSRESADAYEGFLGSLSSYYREVAEEPEEREN